MKTFIFLLCCVVTASAQTQSPDANATTTNSFSQTIVGYQTGVQDGNSRVWRKIVQSTDAQGSVTYQTNDAYTELASGLNHLVNNQWIASKEEIDISADGNSALATNGQHQAYFPGDVYNGQIELVTPDGKQLYSRPVGLSYFDGTNSVLIAELTNSTGEILPSGNQVIYTNAFTGFAADLLYTYTKAGFEQDIILREQPPAPTSFGLNPDTTTLQVLSEFFDPPQPIVTATIVPTDAGDLEDDNLDFGVMQMIPGNAFLLGTNLPTVAVNKQWLVLDGRQVLVEEVPFVSIAGQLENLPLPQTTSTQPNPPLNIVSTKRLLPIQRLATVPNKHPMQVAQTAPASSGLVLDYQTVSSHSTNFTFQGDTTYYVSGNDYLIGTNILEGGAVIKFGSSGSLNIYSPGHSVQQSLLTQTAPYRMAVLTSMNDNSVGDVISGSTGVPTMGGTYLTYNLFGGPITTWSYLRFAYAGKAIFQASEGISDTNINIIRNCQFINCSIAIMDSTYDSLNTLNQQLYNVLFSHCGTGIINGAAVFYGGDMAISGQNVTFDQVTNLLSVWSGDTYAKGSSRLTNSVLTGVQYQIYFGDNGGSTNISTNDCYIAGSGSGIYQTAGAGYYYLTNSSPCRNAGTTNIDPTLLADLKQKTTYPPLFLTNQTLSVNTNFNPQALRDTNSSPDLGYHYDPLDYFWNNLSLTNATMTLTNGVAIGVYGYSGLTLQNGATLVSQGTPLTPNQLVNYHSVQEQSTLLGAATNTACTYLNPTATNSVIRLRFTDVSTVAMPHDTIYFVGGTGLNSFNLMDCQVSAMLIYIYDSMVVSPGYVGITNNIFWRCHTDFGNIFNTYSLNFYNNLCLGGEVDFYGGSSWNVENNLFDTIITAAWTGVVSDYNGYYNSTELSGGGYWDQIIYADDYQRGPLGSYYYPTNGYYNLSWLLNSGSTTASALGLYHYTMTTNQVVEGANTVSIGFHYMALDANGNPLDSNSDGIPDYIEDANGDGIFDAGDPSDWQSFFSLKVLITRPRNGSSLP